MFFIRKFSVSFRSSFELVGCCWSPGYRYIYILSLVRFSERVSERRKKNRELREADENLTTVDFSQLLDVLAISCAKDERR